MKRIYSILQIIILGVSSASFPRVTTPMGTIEGVEQTSVKGRIYKAFEGIPFARPPVGNFRFEEAVPPDPWTGVLKAKTMFKCMQYDHFTPPGQDMVSGDEDCLYVNVYTPSLNQSERVPVLVYIHGGAFMFNYGGQYGPGIILDKDVVYVNFNYRLGPLGFLSTEDEVLPGNNGLKDQILALKWIKANIGYFGGDPNSITILGMSAGGASVQFHYLLSKSKGLFSKGISQSGVTLNPWVLVEKPLEKTRTLSSSLGCPTENNELMVSCLRMRPGRQIVHAVKQFQQWLYNPFSPFGVVVDSWAKEPVLPEHPYELLKAGKVQDLPWLLSYTSAEGLYPASDFYNDELLADLDKNWNTIMPFILHYNDVSEEEWLDSIGEKIRQEYLGTSKLGKSNYREFVKILSDRLFLHDIEKAARLHAAAVESHVYCYHFDYRGAHSKSEFRTNSSVDVGVSHGDDTSYVLKTQLDTLSTEADRKMSDILIDMFLSFMNTGAPTENPDWKPLSRRVNMPWNQLHISGPDDLYSEERETIVSSGIWDELNFLENERLFNEKDEL